MAPPSRVLRSLWPVGLVAALLALTATLWPNPPAAHADVAVAPIEQTGGAVAPSQPRPPSANPALPSLLNVQPFGRASEGAPPPAFAAHTAPQPSFALPRADGSPAPPEAQSPPDPSRRRAAARFGVRWERPRLCLDGEVPRVDRAALLAGFRPLPKLGWMLFADAAVAPERADEAIAGLREGIAFALAQLGPRVAEVPAPRVYLYRSAEQLVHASCVSAAARGYYDGSIHVAAEADLNATLVHELMHHVLNGLGVASPMWLHEGLAMLAAREQWWSSSALGLQEWLRHDHLPFDALTTAFPHTADELFAGAVYFQSYAMVLFLSEQASTRTLEERRSAAAPLGELVLKLANGAFPPEEAFSAAASLTGADLDDAFTAFVNRRFIP
jgi:hypothetical protein